MKLSELKRKRLLSVSEAAFILGIGASTLRAAKHIPHTRTPGGTKQVGCRRYLTSDILAEDARRRVKGNTPTDEDQPSVVADPPAAVESVLPSLPLPVDPPINPPEDRLAENFQELLVNVLDLVWRDVRDRKTAKQVCDIMLMLASKQYEFLHDTGEHLK